jgi:predicted  nucleic acid-binding Zn-ribbon protein
MNNLIIQQDEVPSLLADLARAHTELENGISSLKPAQEALVSGNTPLGQAELQIQDGMAKITAVMERLSVSVQTRGGAQFGSTLQDWNRVVSTINADIADVQKAVNDLAERINDLSNKLNQNRASLEQDVRVFQNYLGRMQEADHL